MVLTIIVSIYIYENNKIYHYCKPSEIYFIEYPRAPQFELW